MNEIGAKAILLAMKKMPEVDPMMTVAIDIAIAALQKQIPAYPIIEQWAPALCPSCGRALSENMGDGYYKHEYGKIICDCGQKLKWE